MSATLYDLCVNITANDSEAVNGINNVGHSTEGLSAKAVAMGQIMADAFEAVIKKVAEFGEKIIQVGMDQETALAKVNTIMDKTKMSTGEMADAITDLSNEMGISVSELSDTVYNAISATGDTAHAVELAGQASKLATAGFTDTSSALSTLTTAMNAYHMSAEDVEHISDSLITVQNLGVTTVDELSASMGKAIASASAYGVDLENLESAYISITKAGINTAEGTTYISSMMKELGDSGSNVSKVLQEVAGKSFDQLMKEGASLGDVLEILNASVDGDATALMNLWSSAEAGKASSAIVGQGLEQFNENLKALQTTTGTTEKAFETMAQTLEHKVGILKTVGENLMSSLYKGLSGNAGDIVEFGTDLINQLAEAFEQGGIETLAFRFGEVVSQAIQKLNEYIPSVMEIGGQLLLGLVDGLAEGATMMAQSATDIIQKLIEGLTSALPELIQSGAIIINEVVVAIAQALPELIPAVVDMVLTIVDALIDNVDLLVDGAIALQVGLAEGLINAMPMLIERVPEIVVALVEAIITEAPKMIMASLSLMTMFSQGMTDITTSALTPVVDSITTFFTQTIPSAVDQLISFLEKVPQWWAELPTKLAYHLGLALGRFVEWISQLVNKAPDVQKNVTDRIVKFFSELPSKIWTHLSSAFQRFSQWFSDMSNKVASALPSLINQIVSGFSSLPSTLADIGRNVVQGFWNGITDRWDSMMSDLKAKVEKVKDAFKEGFDTHSPSRWFMWLGQMNTLGFMEGMKDLMNPVGIASGIQRSLDSLGSANYQIKGFGFGSEQNQIYNQTINVNQKISTPDELAREIRLESRYGLMRGVALG